LDPDIQHDLALTVHQVAEIEREFDMQIADEDLTASLFKSLATLAEYVQRQLAEQRDYSREGTSA